MVSGMTVRLLMAAGVSMIALTAPALAQQPQQTPTPPRATAGSPGAPGGTAAGNASGGIEEIIVTAQRQSQSLQDVPIAVTALTGDTLAKQNITNTTLLQQALPSVSFTKTNFTSSNFVVRGVGNSAVASSADAGVGVNFNEVPIVSPLLFEAEYYDLQRIELLRGPQGTLFGRNATSGAINIITQRPTNDFEIGGEFEYGNFNSKRATGVINVPFKLLGLGESLGGLRVSGYYLNRDGFTKNVFNNTRIDGRDSYGYRASLRLTPTSNTTFDLVGQFFRENSDRSRNQKQQCVRDATGVLGCAGNALATEAPNANATLASVLTSAEFLRLNFNPTPNPGAGFVPGTPAFTAAAAQLDAAATGLALGSIYGPDAYAGALVPQDVRTVSTAYQPFYRASETIVSARLEHRFDKATLVVIGGYQKQFNSTSVDYNLVVPNAIPATVLPTLNAVFPGKSAALFQGQNICVSNVNRNYVGYLGGDIFRCSPRTLNYDLSRGRYEQESIEAHLDSKFDGPLNFLVGANFLHLKGDTDYFVGATGLDYASLLLTGAAPAGLASPFFNNETNRYTLNAYAGFGELYYKPTDTLKLTVGLRYTVDEKKVKDVSPQPLLNYPVPFGTQTIRPLLGFRNASRTDKALTGRAVIDWKPQTSFTDDTLIYASYSRGYKGGGINPAFDQTKFTAPIGFDPEFINAFEIGTKNRFRGGHFQANLTGFYYDYKGLQVTRIINRTSFNDNTDATIYGIEGEFLVAPTDRLLVGVTSSWLHTSIGKTLLTDPRDPSAGRSDVVIVKDITNASNCVLIPTAAGVPRADGLVNAVNAGLNAATGAGLQGTTPIPGTNTTGAFSICSQLASTIAAAGLPYQLVRNNDGSVLLPDGVQKNLKGNPLSNAPDWKVSRSTLSTTAPLGGDWTGVIRGDLNFTGSQQGRNYGDAADRIKPYEIVNLSAQINTPNDRFYVRGFVTNLFDTNATVGLYLTDPSSGLFTNIYTVEPRRYGIAVGAKFR